MQIVSNADNLHEMSNPVFWNKKNVITLSSTELAPIVVKVETIFPIERNVCRDRALFDIKIIWLLRANVGPIPDRLQKMTELKTNNEIGHLLSINQPFPHTNNGDLKPTCKHAQSILAIQFFSMY